MKADLARFLGLFPKQVRVSVVVAIIVSALLSVLDFASVLLLFPVFASLTGGQNVKLPVELQISPNTLVVLAIGLMIVRSLSTFGFRYWWSGKVAGAEVLLSSRLLRGYAYAPFSFHLRRNSSELLSRAISHVNIATNSGLNSIISVVADVTTAVALAAALFVASPQAALVVLLYLTVVAGIFSVASLRTAARSAEKYGRDVTSVYSQGANVLRGIRELTVAGARDQALASIARARGRMVHAQRVIAVLNDVPRVTLEVALFGAILAALLFALHSDNNGANLSVIALYVVAGLRILPALARGLGTVNQLRTGLSLSEQVHDELAEISRTGEQHHRPAEDLPHCGDLRVEEIYFEYEQSQPVLRGVSFTVPFGSHIAITGPSGGGKSTLLGVLLGLLKPDAGAVTYGGADIGVADDAWLRKVGYVPQDVFLLDDTLARNVALGDETPDAVRIRESLRMSSLGPFVEGLPQGLETGLGEGGSRLSVGQRQRLGIARALYREPELLVLDEPTSALDGRTEAQITETINGLRGRLTVITVAHRLETVQLCDAVYRLVDGRVATVVS
jgi:ATP-binding cassette, subfamily B, bacterial PglK